MNSIDAFDPDLFLGSSKPATVPAVAHPVIPKAWSHGLSLLDERSLPRGADAMRWAQIVADAGRIARDLRVIAAAWPLECLFGFGLDIHDESLAVFIRGRRLVCISARDAVVANRNQYSILRPRIEEGATCIWNFKEERRPRR